MHSRKCEPKHPLYVKVHAGWQRPRPDGKSGRARRDGRGAGGPGLSEPAASFSYTDVAIDRYASVCGSRLLCAEMTKSAERSARGGQSRAKLSRAVDPASATYDVCLRHDGDIIVCTHALSCGGRWLFFFCGSLLRKPMRCVASDSSACGKAACMVGGSRSYCSAQTNVMTEQRAPSGLTSSVRLSDGFGGHGAFGVVSMPR